MAATEEIKISSLDTADALTENDLVTGIRDLEGVFTNKNFTSDQLVSYVLSKSRKKITAVTDSISDGGRSLTDPFFEGAINEIVMNNQIYLRDEDFTQAGSKITMIENGFVDGKKLIAKK